MLGSVQLQPAEEAGAATLAVLQEEGENGSGPALSGRRGGDAYKDDSWVVLSISETLWQSSMLQLWRSYCDSSIISWAEAG